MHSKLSGNNIWNPLLPPHPDIQIHDVHSSTYIMTPAWFVFLCTGHRVHWALRNICTGNVPNKNGEDVRRNIETFLLLFYIYRPQTKFVKVMFLHLSVSHSVQGGMLGGVHGREAYMAGGVHRVCMAGGVHGGHAWQGYVCGRGVCVAVGGMHGGGHVWWECVCHACPPRHYKIRSVNARAVRILLECILVMKSYLKQ